MSEEISIKGLNKAQVLAALYNNAQPLGLGKPLHTGSEKMTVREAEKIIKRNPTLNFGYLGNRPLKISLAGDTIEPWKYERDNGNASRVIESVRANPLPEHLPAVPLMQKVLSALHLRA